jgi:hypothetical protein
MTYGATQDLRDMWHICPLSCSYVMYTRAMDHLTLFAATAIALYAGHHVGDYWAQSHHQSLHKGKDPVQCLLHVLSYLAAQTACLFLLVPLGARFGPVQLAAGLLLSGASHYTADRREHGLLFWLARRMPWKAGFLTFGVPRSYSIYAKRLDDDLPEGPIPLDNPSLGTGPWALDQAWHIFFGVFLTALVIAA